MIRVTDEFVHSKLSYKYDEYHMAARFQIIKMPQVSTHFIHRLITANFVCERQIEVIIIASYMVRTILGMGLSQQKKTLHRNVVSNWTSPQPQQCLLMK